MYLENSCALAFIVELIKVNQEYEKIKKTEERKKTTKCNFQKKYDVIEGKLENESFQIENAHYLLGQIIRAYRLADDHWYISEAAKAKWEQLSSESIWDYTYDNKINCCNEEPETIELFKGNAKEFYASKTFVKGTKFRFNDIFHDEHMIDIATIIDELTRLEAPTPDNVKKILDQIRMARILKTEDKRIGKKSKRGMDLEKIFDMYEKANIKLLPKQ